MPANLPGQDQHTTREVITVGSHEFQRCWGTISHEVLTRGAVVCVHNAKIGRTIGYFVPASDCPEDVAAVADDGLDELLAVNPWNRRLIGPAPRPRAELNGATAS